MYKLLPKSECRFYLGGMTLTSAIDTLAGLTKLKYKTSDFDTLIRIYGSYLQNRNGLNVFIHKTLADALSLPGKQLEAVTQRACY